MISKLDTRLVVWLNAEEIAEVHYEELEDASSRTNWGKGTVVMVRFTDIKGTNNIEFQESGPFQVLPQFHCVLIFCDSYENKLHIK